ncbi:MAG TPA: hypothetical protein VFU36_13435 [Jatrophihabitans sp.]|nr:hypothetical protein [Jatrophihabitans sp.]
MSQDDEMSQGDEWLASAVSEPQMKVVLETEGEQPQVLTEWPTSSWSGQPNETYSVEGTVWRATGFREQTESDGTLGYHVQVVQADQSA